MTKRNNSIYKIPNLKRNSVNVSNLKNIISYQHSPTLWLIHTPPKPYLSTISLTFVTQVTLPASLRLLSK